MPTPTSLLSSEDRLKQLLRRGYLPAELPPPFNARSFGDNATVFAAKWKGEDVRKFWTAPETHSIPRNGHVRRKLSIVNPVNQLHVAHLIAENWTEIELRLNRSTITEFKPRFSSKSYGRAITGVDFDGVARERARLLATFGRYVKTDIARFYPSIYTHAIAWSILGKATVKQCYQLKSFKDHYSNLLDKAVSAGQEGQTIGIPIGPDTSRIISELIAVEIEQHAQSIIPDFMRRTVRYVDDMLIGLEAAETADAILADLSRSLYEYELELNAGKTATFGMGLNHAQEWIHQVRGFRIVSGVVIQRDDIDSFFEQSLFLADRHPDESVLLFAVKKAASFEVNSGNVAHLVRWLIYMARRSSLCLSFVADYLSTIHGSIAQASSEVEAFILEQIPLKASSGHTNELAWLLFWAREIGLSVPANILANVVQLRSSVAALLTLDLCHRNLIKGVLDVSEWQSLATQLSLRSEMWLLAYEATRKGWWPKAQESTFIESQPFFSDIWSADVTFYDTSAKAHASPKPFSSPASTSLSVGASSPYPE